MQKVSEPLKKIETIQVNNISVLARMLATDRIEAVLVTQQELDSFLPTNEYYFLRLMDLNVHVWLTNKNEKLVSIFDSLIKNHLEKGYSFID